MFLGCLAAISFAAELWVGVRLFSWWPGLFLWIPPTLVIAILTARVQSIFVIPAGFIVVVIGLNVMFGESTPWIRSLSAWITKASVFVLFFMGALNWHGFFYKQWSLKAALGMQAVFTGACGCLTGYVVEPVYWIQSSLGMFIGGVLMRFLTPADWLKK